MAAWTAAPISRSICPELNGNVLSARRVVTRNDAKLAPRSSVAAARFSASRSAGTSRAREKFATPKTLPTRSWTVSHGVSSGTWTPMREEKGCTVTPGRSDSAWRRLSASFSTKKGRLRPFSAISW